MKKEQAVLYIHGKGGSASEADFYRDFVRGDVIGLDYEVDVPWVSVEAVRAAFDRLAEAYERVSVIGNSIGAWFVLLALGDRAVKEAFFVSPVVDMEALITAMMGWAGVSEQDLREKKLIPTPFGETLSWDYLCYVRSHPIRWNHPTVIACGEHDHLVPGTLTEAFAREHNASLAVMPDGEHWFHTPEQMDFLKKTLTDHPIGKD